MILSIFSYALTFIEGILTFISPCILPMLPIYFLYLAGTSEKDDTVDIEKSKSSLLINSIGFVIGFSLVFVALGATVTSIGHFLVIHKGLLRQISGAIMILFGLNFTGLLKLKFLDVEKRIDFKFNRLGFLNSIVFGMVFGFGWSPCLGAFLGSALALAGNSDTVLEGIMLLLVYSIGLGIPFIISSILFEKVKGTFVWIKKHSAQINLISGILLVAAGILVFTDVIKYL